MTNKQTLTELFNEANRLSCEESKYTTHDLWEMCKQIEEDLDVLEQYKNTEKKLGIDFITLYEALTNGVWVKNEEGQIYHTLVYLQNLILSSSPSEIKLGRFCFITPDNVLLLFNRIKQDWALTKEELLWD